MARLPPVRHVGSRPAPSSDGPRPVLVQTMEGAETVLRRLREQPLAIYDCETNGLDWRTERIVGHVLTFGPRPDDTYYVPVRHGMADNLGNVPNPKGIIHITKRVKHPFEVEMDKILRTRRDLHLVGHHFMFDLMFLFGEGIKFVGTAEDTEVNDALLDEHAASHSLEQACLSLGVTPKKGTELYQHMASKFGGAAERRTQMGNYWRLAGNDPIGFDYAAGDGTSTWDLYHKQLEVLREQELEDIRQLESKITRVIYRMSRRGTRIDVPGLHNMIVGLQERIAEAEKALPKDLGINKPSQLKEYFTKLGHTDWPMTEPTKRYPSGNPSFKEEWLKTHQPGRNILAVRKLTHLLDSFAVPLRDKHLFNGRVHATFHQMANDEFGTVTGRFSCSGPNLQQVHKRNKELGTLFRSIFIPDDGMVWVDADLSQCEPRLLAHYGQVQVLIDGYLASPPVDAHTAVAEAANIDRESGKRLNQTLITGGGRKRIVELLGPGGDEIYNAYFRAMPEVKTLQKQAAWRLKQRGYIISLLGRRARLESSDKDYLAINRLLQCGNADIIKKAMVEVDGHFESGGDLCHLLNTVHDALSAQFPKEGSADDIAEMMRIMSDFGPEGRSVYLTVPMAVEYGMGANWAEATYTKDKVMVGA